MTDNKSDFKFSSLLIPYSCPDDLFVHKIAIILPQSTRAKLSDVNGDYQKKETGQYSIIYDKNTG